RIARANRGLAGGQRGQTSDPLHDVERVAHHARIAIHKDQHLPIGGHQRRIALARRNKSPTGPRMPPTGPRMPPTPPPLPPPRPPSTRSASVCEVTGVSASSGVQLVSCPSASWVSPSVTISHPNCWTVWSKTHSRSPTWAPRASTRFCPPLGLPRSST